MKSTYGVKLQPTDDKWPSALGVSLFCTVVVFSGLYQLVLDLTSVSVPLQVLARFCLLAAAVPVFVLVKRDGLPLAPSSVRAASIFMLLAACSSFAKDFGNSGDAVGPFADFVFMFGIGALIAIVAVIPLSARFGKIFAFSSVVCIAFAAFQLVTQNLHLPAGYLESVGILYENFVNDKVRIVSFFRSAPRFAEFLVIISLVLLKLILQPRQNGVWRSRAALAIAYVVVVVLLYNTFSRAGYILFLTSSALLMILTYRSVRGRRGVSIVHAYALMSSVALVGVLILAEKFPLDRAILDITSYRSRQQNWSMLTDRLATGSVPDFMLGFGEAARYARGDYRYYVTDNLVLTLMLYCGILGLIAVVAVTIATVRHACFVRRASKVSTLDPWIAYIPGLWVEGLFLDNHNTLFLALLAMLGVTASVSRAYFNSPAFSDGLPEVAEMGATTSGGRKPTVPVVGSMQWQHTSRGNQPERPAASERTVQ